MSRRLWPILPNRTARQTRAAPRPSLLLSPRAWLCLVGLAVSWPMRAVHAQDEPDPVAAKQLFEQGVAAAANKDWEVAAGLFDESLRRAEHPATRFNLLLANDELGRSLEVVRHAWAFLDLPETESRPEARVQVRDLLERATR